MTRPDLRQPTLAPGQGTRRCLPTLLLAIALSTGSLGAQEIEKDYSRYARPFLFVMPKPLVANRPSSSVSTFVARLDINADGSVREPVEVAPAEPAMVAAVNEVARFWLFYPELSSDCKPARRTGSIEFDYDESEGRAWIQIAPLTGARPTTEAPTPRLIRSAPPPEYPRAELLGGTEGRVIIAMKVLADGSTAEPVVYFAAPGTSGLARAALKHVRGHELALDEPLGKPHLCVLVPYEFRIQ